MLRTLKGGLMQDNLHKHFVATGFVLNPARTKMLMIYHRKLDRWAAPGGHLEEDELPEEAVSREVFEETGIQAKVITTNYCHWELDGSKEKELSTPYTVLAEYIPENFKNEAHIHIDFIYLCEADETTPIKQESEVKQVKWMTWKEILASNTFGSIKQFAQIMLNKGGEQSCENLDLF